MSQRGSLSAYARHIGASPAYVTRLKQAGRLVLVPNPAGGRDLVDFELSDRMVQNTTDQARAGNGANATPGGREPSRPVAPVVGPVGADTLFRRAQASEKEFQAKRAELAYLREVGTLVSVADVRAAYARKASGLREALLQIPARLAAVLAAEADPEKCYEVLEAELHQVLQQLTQGVDQAELAPQRAAGVADPAALAAPGAA